MPVRFSRQSIPGIILIEGIRFSDDRGFFREIYKHSEFSTQGLAAGIAQMGYSSSRKRVLRGLHYQKRPRAQAKLVVVLRGAIFDVVVDIRRGSPTYGSWMSAVLSESNHKMLFVPEGFAHGFCVLSAQADVLYGLAAEYDPGLDRGILWSDPQIGISWPIRHPILSQKDASLPLLEAADNNFEYEAAG
jgi:dTDP-4-dehydrorhamnose 3,5-epimerase